MALGWKCGEGMDQHRDGSAQGAGMEALPCHHHTLGPAETGAESNPLCLLPSPRVGLDSSAGETLPWKGHCLNQHLNDIPNLFLKFINPFVFSSSKTLSQDIM